MGDAGARPDHPTRRAHFSIHSGRAVMTIKTLSPTILAPDVTFVLAGMPASATPAGWKK